MFNDELELKVQKHERDIRKLSIDLDNIRRQNQSLFDDLNVSSCQVSQFMSDPAQFTTEDWAHLVQEKKRIDDKREMELKNIRNPAQVKKTLTERAMPNHWIYVR